MALIMDRIATLISIWLALTALASAQLSDIRLQESPNGAVVAISFDSPPMGIILTQDSAGASILIEGVEAGEFQLEPAHSSIISRIDLRPIDGGTIVQFYAVHPWAEVTTMMAGNDGIVQIRLADELDASPTQPAQTHTMASLHDAPDIPIETADVEVELVTVEIAVEDVIADAVMPTAPAAETEAELATQSAPATCVSESAAVDLEPWGLDALTVLARCHNNAGRPQEARPHLERVLAFEPARYDANILLAEIAQGEGQTDEAHALFNQAASSARTDGQAAAARARARATVSAD